MKRRIALAALVLLLVCGVAGGTTAYYTTTAQATNVITTGGIDVDLQEWADEDGTPFEDVLGVLPGRSVTKIVTAKNIGPNEAWVRLRFEKSVQLAEGVEGEVDPALVELDLNTEDWIEKDGWYYYSQKLLPGEISPPLFTEVNFAEEMGNVWQGSTVTIDVEMHAVQVANNGVAVLEAAGWPEPMAE